MPQPLEFGRNRWGHQCRNQNKYKRIYVPFLTIWVINKKLGFWPERMASENKSTSRLLFICTDKNKLGFGVWNLARMRHQWTETPGPKNLRRLSWVGLGLRHRGKVRCLSGWDWNWCKVASDTLLSKSLQLQFVFPPPLFPHRFSDPPSALVEKTTTANTTHQTLKKSRNLRPEIVS